MKRCNRCGEEKSLDSFCKRSTAKDGRNSACRVCAKAIARKWNAELTPYQRRRKQERERLWRANKATFKERIRRYYVKRLYGLDASAYDAMLERQRSVCAICGGVQSSGRNLAVDHDHGTGAVRGLLCGNCNNGLGRFKDSGPLLVKAAEYLSGVALKDPSDHQYCQVDC